MARDWRFTEKSPDSPRTHRVTFQAAADGPVLRGVLHLPEQGSGPFPAAIICHPHTQMGGNMGNGIVVSLCLELAVAGWAALRFNFRGAGDSEGSFDGGDGWTRPPKERDDVKGAADFLFVQPEVDPDELVVIGYSFGAGVALHHAARDQRLRRMVGIALVKQHYEDPFLDGDRRPKLFIAGEDDPWAPAAALREYVKRLEPPKKLHVVRRAGHLFAGHTAEVTNVIVDWLSG
jgi:hypothetical protein